MRKIILFYVLFFVTIQAEELFRVTELSGAWKFEIGDNMSWAESEFDDSRWESIKVPSDWESEGFPGYDGYAWYRRDFTIDKDQIDEIYYLRLGVIDDSDMTFVNGKLVGQTGGFHPDYYTGYPKLREYRVPSEYLNRNGNNVIAIRVYDEGREGGLCYGQIELAKKSYGFQRLISLEGSWKFRPGDNDKWKDTDYDDRKWKELILPEYWEHQGFEDLGEFAWYRKKVLVDDKYADQNLILLLGKIDDVDEAYINGHLIGSTGIMPDNNHDFFINDIDHRTIRAYYIPKKFLNHGGENQIAIRVFDGFNLGGIYDGPLGVINREQFRNFLEYSNQSKFNIKEDFKVQLFLDKIFKTKSVVHKKE